MEEMKCEVIRDLLPLYEDNAVSEETQELVRRHLKDCPACREELRKMRTPVSLPPEADKELWERFQEKKKRLERKKKITTISIVSVLIFLVVFSLSYTLIPRSWNRVAGPARAMEPDRVLAVQILDNWENGRPSMESWKIDEQLEENTQLINSVMEALRAASYRAELRNVMNSTPFGPFFQIDEINGLRSSFYLYLDQDNLQVASIQLFDLYDHIAAHIRIHRGSDLVYFYRVDGQLYDKLSALMQEYGVKSD